MNYIRRCVMARFPGSVAYLYPKELRQGEMSYLSVDELRSRFDKLLPDKRAARDIDSDVKT